ncbi:MAG: hypothetical protein LAQ30_14005 [Acidobacteriia bacterium]|nr:hypothetical protein [Terriglobia bacterium]
MRRDAALWAAILAGPLVWFISMQANFALAPWACALQWTPALFGVSFVSLAITAGSGLLAWSEWQKLGRELPGESGGAVARGRAMALGGMILSAASFLVILAQTIPHVILGACE